MMAEGEGMKVDVKSSSLHPSSLILHSLYYGFAT
jgi:hypothetical protein